MDYEIKPHKARIIPRKHERVEHSAPVRFKSFSLTGDHTAYSEDFSSSGTSMNVSPGGLLFQTNHKPPKLSDVVWIDMDLKTMNTLSLCLDVRHRPLIFNNGFLGKVVHIEEDQDRDIYSVGISFVRKFDATLP